MSRSGNAAPALPVPVRRGRRALVAAAAAGLLVAGFALRGCLRAPPAAGASVLLVTLDTLRADRLGAYGARDARTPNLDALARDGLLFEDARASTPLTLPSHATLLSGLEPPRHGVRDNGLYVFPERPATLTTLLQARGYATGAFVGAYVLDRRFGLARGFDHYGDHIARREQGASVLESERRGEEVVAEAAAWLGAGSGPFLAWVHLYDAHAPYAPPAPFHEEFADRPYQGEVAYVDACLGRLLAAARARAGAHLLVAVLGDHGEALGEHGERTHGLFVYDSTLRIPFLLAGPGIRPARRAGLARSADVLPTLLALLGVAAPPGLDGVDLLAAAPPGNAYAETLYPSGMGWAALFSLRSGTLKYIEAPRPELYDLASDPGEANDLSKARPQDLERLRRALESFRGDDRPDPGSLDPAVAERLRSLGYVGAAVPSLAASRQRRDPKDAVVLWRRYEEALWAQARGEHVRAAGLFAGLVAEEPDNGAFRRTLAAALRQAGRPREAAEALSGIERFAPDDPTAWHELAVALSDAGRIEEAVRAEERALALNPLLPEPASHLGILQSRLGRHEEALRSFERATTLDPNNALAWNNRANALHALNRPDEAREAYQTAARLAPEKPDSWNGLGVLAVERRDLAEAAALFRKVLEIDPSHLEAALNLAFTEARLGRLSDARSRLREVVRRTKDPALRRRAASLLAELT